MSSCSDSAKQDEGDILRPRRDHAKLHQMRCLRCAITASEKPSRGTRNRVGCVQTAADEFCSIGLFDSPTPRRKASKHEDTVVQSANAHTLSKMQMRASNAASLGRVSLLNLRYAGDDRFIRLHGFQILPSPFCRPSGAPAPTLRLP